MAAVGPPPFGGSLDQWLAYVERLHPKTIEFGLDRIRVVADRMALVPNALVITVGGTNGKGSTCAMLESILLAAGYKVALYTSPHLVRFNERARLNGASLSDGELVRGLEAVERARQSTSLSYFEYTTLAIVECFRQAAPDVIVLEVGLGGRLDAVNLFDADCSIVTSIDIDHADYLGNTREKIAWEKAHIYRSGRPAICSDPLAPDTLIGHAADLGADLWLFGRDFNYSGDRQQWSYGGREQRRSGMAYPAIRGANQLLNAAGVLAALESLRMRLPVSQQAVRQGLAQVELPGRFQVLPGRPIVVLDVAHNPHAAAHLAQNLDQQGFYPYTYGVFGMMRDKDIAAVIGHLKGRIDHWLVTDLPGTRAATAAELLQSLSDAAVLPGPERKILGFSEPALAYRHALEQANENDRIVVFGSFITVGQIIEYLSSVGRPS